VGRLEQVPGGRRGVSAAGSPVDWSHTIESLFDRIPYGLFTVNDSGTVLALNAAGRRLLLGATRPSREPLTCCDLVCDWIDDGTDAPRCLTQEVLGARQASSEIEARLHLRGGPNTAWVTVSSLGEGGGAIFHLRAEQASEPRRSSGAVALPSPRLRVFALGQTRVESAAGGSIGGRWIEQRPGQLLKYLVCARQRVVDADEITQALWPRAKAGTLSSVRYFVHMLRTRLEPTREAGTPSSFIVSRGGGYAVNTARVWIDATEFEQGIAAGLAALAAEQRDVAVARLERAMSLYRGDFLEDEPYAEWALAERDRLRELAGRALRALTELRLATGAVELAARHARRLADLEPHDSDAQRRHIEFSLSRGRRSEAVRRYRLFRRRLARDFGEEPDFTLADLTHPAQHDD
jgi:DNA-binding SARP family transcriptional activator